MTSAEPSFCLSELRSLCQRRATPAQKLILAILTLHPEGLSLKEIMVFIRMPAANRKSMQRLLEWPLAQGWITREEGGHRRFIYRRRN